MAGNLCSRQVARARSMALFPIPSLLWCHVWIYLFRWRNGLNDIFYRGRWGDIDWRRVSIWLSPASYDAHNDDQAYPCGPCDGCRNDELPQRMRCGVLFRSRSYWQRRRHDEFSGAPWTVYTVSGTISGHGNYMTTLTSYRSRTAHPTSRRCSVYLQTGTTRGAHYWAIMSLDVKYLSAWAACLHNCFLITKAYFRSDRTVTACFAVENVIAYCSHIGWLWKLEKPGCSTAR
jgi:hypothetical protein